MQLQERSFVTTVNFKIASVSFRSKDDGWRNYNMVIRLNLNRSLEKFAFILSWNRAKSAYCVSIQML